MLIESKFIKLLEGGHFIVGSLFSNKRSIVSFEDKHGFNLFSLYYDNKQIYCSLNFVWAHFANYTNTIQEVAAFLELQFQKHMEVKDFHIIVPSDSLLYYPQKV